MKMSYQVIRNKNYKIDNLTGIYRHNNRLNQTYTNKDINHELTHENYYLKKSDMPYEKKVLALRKQNNLTGQLQKTSNVLCEFIITSDKNFFKPMTLEEEKNFFQTCFDFVAKKVEEKNIVEAVVHKDEKTPHLHIVFLPVIDSINKKTKQPCRKLSCSEFWKGKDSYQKLQDSFQKFIKEHGYNLQRGKSDRQHLSVKDFKEITNYNDIQTLTPIKTKGISKEDIDSLNKKQAREELKIKVNEIAQLQRQNEILFLQNKRLKSAINIAEEKEYENENLKNTVTKLQNENYNIRFEHNSLLKKFNKLYDTFEYFISKIQNIFLFFNSIFTKQQKQENTEIIQIIEDVSKTETETIINNTVDVMEQEKKKQKREKDFDLEL